MKSEAFRVIFFGDCCDEFCQVEDHHAFDCGRESRLEVGAEFVISGWWFGTFPQDPCMEYLPTFTPKIAQMQVNIPYMDPMGFVMFPYMGNVIMPADEAIFFRGLARNQQPDDSR